MKILISPFSLFFKSLKFEENTKGKKPILPSVHFSSVAQSCLTLCNPMNCSTPGFPVHHQLPELIQTHVHWVGDAIQPSHPLSSPCPPAFNHSQHRGLFKWVSSSHWVAKFFPTQFIFHESSFQFIYFSSVSKSLCPLT